MIRELKAQEEYLYMWDDHLEKDRKLNQEKIFVNHENLIHNDVGPASIYDNGTLINSWWWNGYIIE